MDFGKVVLALGGVVVVGAVGAAVVGAPAELESSVPVGVFEVQMPADFFDLPAGEAELAPDIVVAPEVIAAPEPKPGTKGLVAPAPAPEEEPAPAGEDDAAASAQAVTAAAQAAEEYAAQAHALGGCSGGP